MFQRVRQVIEKKSNIYFNTVLYFSPIISYCSYTLWFRDIREYRRGECEEQLWLLKKLLCCIQSVLWGAVEKIKALHACMWWCGRMQCMILFLVMLLCLSISICSPALALFGQMIKQLLHTTVCDQHPNSIGQKYIITAWYNTHGLQVTLANDIALALTQITS